LLIIARRFRSQDQNRKDAQERLLKLIDRATRPMRKRLATKPTPASKVARLESKKYNSIKKAKRSRKIELED